MAMQLAYRRLHGKGTPTYETASTRLFLHGRTETIRTYSEDSQRWVEAVIAGKTDVSNTCCVVLTSRLTMRDFLVPVLLGEGALLAST